MSIFWIIYILGVIVTLYLLYYNLDKGDIVTIFDLVLAVMMSSFSWITFFIALTIICGDKEIFKKK